MTDLPRDANQANADDAPVTKRPWRTPVVIVATAYDTEKPSYYNEASPGALPSLQFGPS